MVDTKAHSPETHPVSAAANAVEDSGAIMIKNPVGCLGAIALGMIVGILLLVATCSKLTERRSGDTHLVPSDAIRSEEHTSELQSLMRISYAVFFLKKKTHKKKTPKHKDTNHKNKYSIEQHSITIQNTKKTMT